MRNTSTLASLAKGTSRDGRRCRLYVYYLFYCLKKHGVRSWERWCRVLPFFLEEPRSMDLCNNVGNSWFDSTLCVYVFLDICVRMCLYIYLHIYHAWRLKVFSPGCSGVFTTVCESKNATMTFFMLTQYKRRWFAGFLVSYLAYQAFTLHRKMTIAQSIHHEGIKSSMHRRVNLTSCMKIRHMGAWEF